MRYFKAQNHPIYENILDFLYPRHLVISNNFRQNYMIY